MMFRPRLARTGRARRPAALRAEPLEPRALPAQVFTVTTIADSGPGSLRQAIENANLAAGADVIAFDIPGPGVKTIALLSALPLVTGPVAIDGATQPGFLNHGPVVELDGGALPSSSKGFVFEASASGSTIQSIAFGGFDDAAIKLNGCDNVSVTGSYFGLRAGGQPFPTRVTILGQNFGNRIGIDNISSDGTIIGGTAQGARNVFGSSVYGVNAAHSSGLLIQGNLFGTDPTGLSQRPNLDNIFLFNSHHNTVGGATAGARNVIASAHRGLYLNITHDTLVQGNYFGVDAAGARRFANTESAIHVAGARNTIGGAAAGAGNLISGNNYGVILYSGGTDGLPDQNAILGNVFGLDASGQIPLGNSVAIGIFDAQNNSIGGTAAGAGNVIAHSTREGIRLEAILERTPTGNAILSNSIFGSHRGAHEAFGSGLGIDLDANGVTPNSPGGPHSGSNRRQNFPVISAASRSGDQLSIDGTLNAAANTTFIVQLFANRAANASNHGEGETLLTTLSVNTDAFGNAGFHWDGPAPDGAAFITGTATDPEGNTSEFSRALAVTTPPGVVSFRFASAQVREDDGVIVVEVVRTGGPDGLAVSYHTENVTAFSGLDYEFRSGLLVFGPGQTVRTITIPLVNNSESEPGEQFRVVLSNPSSASLGNPSTLTITIHDDDVLAPPHVVPTTLKGIYQKKKLVAIEVAFSDALNAATITRAGVARLFGPGRDKRFGTRDDANIALRAAQYNSSARILKLTLTKPLTVAGEVRLVLNGNLLLDDLNRPVDADRNGSAGGLATIRITKTTLRFA